MTKVVSFDLTKNLLTNMPPGDKIELTKLHTGEFMVTTFEPTMQTKDDILKERFGHLIGQPITLTEAAEKYDIPRATIESWIYRNRYIQIIGESYPMEVNEADIAYCADIYKNRRTKGSKAPLLDENGLPYELKRPDVAEYRRKKKTRN